MNIHTKPWVFLMVALSLPSLASESIPMTVAQQTAADIRLVVPEAQATSMSSRISAEVVIPPAQQAVISTPQAGMVMLLHVAAGEAVNKGQVLAEISSPELVALQGEYLQTLTQTQLAGNMLARDKALFEEGIIAQRRYLTMQSEHVELQAVLAQRKQTLKLAGMSDSAIGQLARSGKIQSTLTLIAPMAGQVLEQYATVGQRLDGAAPLYRIARLNPLWLDIRAPVAILATVREGLAVSVPAVHASGKLIHIVRGVNKADQTILLRAEITHGTDLLLPGQFVEAEIAAIPGTQTTFTLPKSALVRRASQHFVFMQDQQGFVAVPVTLLSESAGTCVVEGAFPATAKIAASGTAAIKGHWLGVGEE